MTYSTKLDWHGGPDLLKDGVRVSRTASAN
jgi:hypothetical protein